MNKQATIGQIDANLAEAGMATYSEILDLLDSARRLGLTFDIGSAYIARSYIDQQDELSARIKAAREAAK